MVLFLCGRRESNPYASRHQILSLACLPISTRPRFGIANVQQLPLIANFKSTKQSLETDSQSQAETSITESRYDTHSYLSHSGIRQYHDFRTDRDIFDEVGNIFISTTDTTFCRHGSYRFRETCTMNANAIESRYIQPYEIRAICTTYDTFTIAKIMLPRS